MTSALPHRRLHFCDNPSPTNISRPAAVLSTFAQSLVSYGAQPGQLVDLAQGSPRALAYSDLLHGDEDWTPPVVIEHERMPRVFVFDGGAEADHASSPVVDLWCRRILLRGDVAYTAIARPGRLDVLTFEVRGTAVERSVQSLQPQSGGLARFIHDVRSGSADLPRRAYLRDLLASSLQQAVTLGVSPLDALSVVGWGLFWRFLVDRRLLVGKTPADIAEGSATWTDCLSTKGRALKTLRWLESTFNGGLLPFEQPPRDFAPEVFSAVLGNIAAGATPQGQLRLPTDWDQIDFSQVPVGLLSEVYEAFATGIDGARARERSVHYTPRHIAEFIVGETLDAMPTVDRPRMLDPAVGAGVFLVTAFRQLVQRAWERSGVRPVRRDIRRILARQLAAFDVDPRALRLTQLGLYLTALELDPDPTPVEDLKFDGLDGVLRLRDQLDGSLASVTPEDTGRYDAIVGNPPWTGRDLTAKSRWVQNTGAKIRGRLGKEADTFDLPDANPDLAFLWRAGEWVRPGGQISLVVHARWLFGLSDRAVDARRRIFTAFNVTGILNGSALRKTQVWPQVDVPFCLVFARNEVSPTRGECQFVSPFVETDHPSGQVRLQVDWSDAQAVMHEEIRAIPWAFKSRFRGDAIARRAFDTVRASGIALSEALRTLSSELGFHNGYQIGGEARPKLPAGHLLGLPDLKSSDADSFLIDTTKLPRFEERKALSPRDPSIYMPPLLLVRKAMPADPEAPRVMRVESSVAFSESFHGLSFRGIADSDDWARLLQLLLQSKVGQFVVLMTDALYGVERETMYQESFNAFPIVPLERLSQGQRAHLRRISKALEQGRGSTALIEMNDFVFELYGLDEVERIAIEDTLQTRGPTAASIGRAVGSTTEAERETFLGELKASLNDVLQASGLSAVVKELPTPVFPWRLVSVTTQQRPLKVNPLEAMFKEMDETGASLVIVQAGPGTVVVGLPDRYRYWTRTRATLLAHDLLGGVFVDG